eukprot:m.101234 g.101234  ORF g.101234 m.101234 type:complete len:55 (+) comp16796_c0_seq4:856-1020(+)
MCGEHQCTSLQESQSKPGMNFTQTIPQGYFVPFSNPILKLTICAIVGTLASIVE